MIHVKGVIRNKMRNMQYSMYYKLCEYVYHILAYILYKVLQY